MTNEEYVQTITEAAKLLTNLDKKQFSRKDIIALVQWKFPNALENTINPMIQGLTDNLKGGAQYTIEKKKIFHSVKRGIFKLI